MAGLERKRAPARQRTAAWERPMAVVWAAALAIACGGSGGEAPGPGPAPVATVELLPPEVAPAPAGGLPAGSAWDAASRPEQDLSGTWRFRFDDADEGLAARWFDPGLDRSGWTGAAVPGTWDPAPAGDEARRTVGWYALSFVAADLGPWPRVRLDGVFRASEVWLNGTRLGGDDLPYLPAWYDAAGALRPGEENVLVVRVDSRMGRDTLPADTIHSPGRHGWWPYGGITRPVVIEGGGEVVVHRARVAARLPGKGDPGAPGTVEVRLDVLRRPGSTGGATLRVRVEGPGGAEALAWPAVELPQGWTGVVRLAGTVASPVEWTPATAVAATYRLEATLEEPGVGPSMVATDFAFRAFAARGGRLYLNGEDVYLHGVNRHEDHPVHGPVFDAEAVQADVALMKTMGVDFCRPAHYPNDVRVLRAMEAAGIMLAEEVPVYQLAGPLFEDVTILDRAVRSVRRMVARDQNRPAVVMWSVANEVWTYVPAAEPFVRALVQAARAEDPERPIMMAVNFEPGLSFSPFDAGVGPVDVVGVNEYWGWYEGLAAELGPYLDAARARWPDKTFFLSEFGGDALRGRHRHRPAADEATGDHSYSEEFQAWLHRQHLRRAAEREWVRGVMPWVFADFRMEWRPSTGKPHPRAGWNLKGLVDGWRKPKMAFEVYRAAYARHDGLALPPEPACGNGVREPGETCDGGPGGDTARPCADLGAAWGAGQALCRDDCVGFDVSGCVPAGGPEVYEVVKPALRDPSRWADARCNDGSPFGFRVRPSPTGSRDWSISIRGGGFCDDAAVPCLRTPDLMSGPPHADRALIVPDDGETGGVLDPSAEVNPALHDANLVFAWYCSSDFWAGTGTEPRPFRNNPDLRWWFSGRLNVAAMLEMLQAAYGLHDDADARVLYSGTSSGALGVAATADLLVDLLPAASAAGRVRLLVDAGWLVHDWDEPDMRVLMATASDAEVMRNAWRELKLRFAPACEREMSLASQHPADCIFGLHYLPALADPPPRGLGLPVLVQQSLMDLTFSVYHNRPDDLAAAARYGERQLADILAVDPDPGPGDGRSAWWFLGWSPYHDICRSSDGWGIGEAGSTFPEVLLRFWDGSPPERVIWDPGGAQGGL